MRALPRALRVHALLIPTTQRSLTSRLLRFLVSSSTCPNERLLMLPATESPKTLSTRKHSEHEPLLQNGGRTLLRKSDRANTEGAEDPGYIFVGGPVLGDV